MLIRRRRRRRRFGRLGLFVGSGRLAFFGPTDELRQLGQEGRRDDVDVQFHFVLVRVAFERRRELLFHFHEDLSQILLGDLIQGFGKGPSIGQRRATGSSPRLVGGRSRGRRIRRRGDGRRRGILDTQILDEFIESIIPFLFQTGG